jgi:SOS-response transcriptional repressor LexA
MTIGGYMKAKRKQLGISLRNAGKLTGMSHVNVKDIENDSIKSSFEKIINLLDAYHADIQEFLSEIGYLAQSIKPEPIEKLNQVPVISMVTAGHWNEACEVFQPCEADEWVSSDVKGQNLFAVRVKGDSMEPEFTEGDIVIMDPHIKPNSGDYVIVRNDEGEATLKQYKQYGNTRILHPLNPKYDEIELKHDHQYVIVGKVVEKKKRY